MLVCGSERSESEEKLKLPNRELNKFVVLAENYA